MAVCSTKAPIGQVLRQMSIIFTNWHKAKRPNYKALGYGARLKPIGWLHVRWWRGIKLFGLAVTAGLALAVAIDQLEHHLTGHHAALRQTDVLRGTSRDAPDRHDAAPRRPEVLRGTSVATIVDGDTLDLGRERFRLHGIDAPESKQRCIDGWQAGAAASRALQSLMEGRRIECERRERDRYGRTVAVCRADGRDLGAAMVRAGMALAFVRYSSDYVQDEAWVKAKRLGLHAHDCIPPWDWRAQRR